MAAAIDNPSFTELPFAMVPCRYAGRCKGKCRHLGDKLLEPDIFTDMDCVRRQRRRSIAVFAAVTALVMAIVFGLTFKLGEQNGRVALSELGSERMHAALVRLGREIDKFGIQPLTIAMDEDVADYLASGQAGDSQARMNRYLARVNSVAGALQTYLVDPSGTIVASSNWADENSFVGRNISYRPYVQKAVAGSVTTYYGIGTTANTPGYYLATAVERDGRRLGVVAIKLDLELLENDWLNGMEQLTMMTDVNRVVVLSSREEWKYRSLGPLDPRKQEELNETQQYNRHVMNALAWVEQAKAADGSRLVTIGDGTSTHTYLASTGFVPAVAMDLTVLEDYTRVTIRAFEYAAAAAFVALLAMLCIRIFNQRRLSVHERLRARAALQQAYDRLKRQFEDRNRELQRTNEELRREVVERVQAARRLQSFQDELIRTENLAVIGQLSAGLAHEMNQPLAALSTLSENAVRFLELNDTGTVRHNLQRIGDLVQRMGSLTGQLRSFARRTDGEIGPISLNASIESTIALLGHRIKKENVVVEIGGCGETVVVMGAAVRLEQVLVNLVSNALDALHGNGEPRIAITSRVEADRAVVEVEDNGHGLTSEVQARLFEPFFTTKKTSGLGLGLAISQDIVRSFGGDLTAKNSPNGGAVFSLTLRLASNEDHTNA